MFWILSSQLKSKFKNLNEALLESRDSKIKKKYLKFWMDSLLHKVSKRKKTCLANNFRYFYKIRNIFEILKQNKLRKNKVINYNFNFLIKI